MTLIVDPDNLNDGTEIVITPVDHTVQLLVAGNLSNDGVTIKCVYSKLKELWKSNATYIKYPFPMGPITDEQFEMVNSWDWKDNTTRYLLRTGGWALKDANGVSQEEWAGVISLGSIGGSDQAYFLQAAGNDVMNFQLTGAVNQAIKVYGDVTHGNFDYRSYLKVYCRIYAKSYALSQLSDIGVSTLTYQAYRFPLANAADPKITHTDANVIGNTPYFGTATKSASDGVANGTTTFTSATVGFAVGDVDKFICIDSGSQAGFYKIVTYVSATEVTIERNMASGSSLAFSVNPAGVQITWYATAQQRNIGGTNYDFHAIIDGNDANAEEIYEFVQYQLRQNNDIDAGSGTEVGKKTNAIFRFVGDTLYTQLISTGKGAFIDNYQSDDINRLVFVDDTGTERTFPYTAVLAVNFGDNLKNDAEAKYWVYFTSVPQGDYGDDDAILVNTTNAIATTTRARASNVATIGTGTVHSLAVGDGVVVSGFGGTGYNVTGIVTVVGDTTHFSYANAGSDETQTADTNGTVTQNISGKISGASSVQKTFAYDTNTQGGRTAQTDAPITAVAIGLATGQFVKTTATIARSIANSTSLVAPLERNYSNP